MKKIKTLGLLLIFSVAPQLKAQGLICDDFTDSTEYPETYYHGLDISAGDTIGYTQGGTQTITFGFQPEPYSEFNIFSGFGMSAAGLTINFAFDGTNQFARFHLGESGGGQTFSVNGSVYTPLSETFPMVVDGITVDLDTSAPDLGFYNDVYLTFSGNLNEVSLRSDDTHESNIASLCVTTLFDEGDCDNFEDMTEWPTTSFGADYLIGYSQGGTQAINSGATTFGDVNGSWPGIYGVGPVDFNFDGTNQVARFKMYGLASQFYEMGFSVNGSPLYYLDGTFPVSVAGVVVNLDSTITDIDEWEYFYLTFTGEIDEISQELFESGVSELCVEHLDEELACDNFLDTETWHLDEEFGEGDVLGYTQDGTYEVSCTDGHGYLNTFGNVGISIGTGIVNFEFSGANQTARFTVYHMGYNDNMGFAVNGSSLSYLDVSFPVVIDGVTVDLDTSPTDPSPGDDIWGNLSYLTFTGEIDDISIYALEGGITELCVEALDSADNAGIHNQTTTQFNLYPNPATNQVTITANAPLNQIQLFALSGELISTELGLGSTQKFLDLSYLESGIYIIKTQLEDGSQYVQKLIKE